MPSSAWRPYCRPFSDIFQKKRSDGKIPPLTRGRILRITFLLAVIFFLVGLAALVTGAGEVRLFAILGHLFSMGTGVEKGPWLDATQATILFSIRLPRIVFAAIVGASLSLSGVIFQAILRNPLADPYILGISGGAALGAVLAIILGAAAIPFGVPGLAFLGALLAIFAVYTLSGAKNDRSGNTLLLTGVIVNAFFAALLMFLLSVSSSDRLQSALFWLMGDLGLAQGREILLAGLVMTGGFLVMLSQARALNVLSLGEETALQLGVDTKRTQGGLLLSASLVTATAVSISGTIGFIGLIIPHLLRLLVGADHRLLLPASALFGATFLVAADTAARTIMAPVELPVGVVTALCGAPYFLYLLHRRAV